MSDRRESLNTAREQGGSERPTGESLLDRYIRKPSDTQAPSPPSVSSLNPAETEGAEDLGCFGFLRGVRDRALMLELRKKDGSVTAIAYAFIERITYSPDPPNDGITIHAAGQKIRITGHNLITENESGVRLFGALARHRVPWIQEINASANASTSDLQTVIESIVS